MKWLVFVLSVLVFCAFSRALQAKEPRTITVSESDVTPIRTALGYTTMLTFDSRPSSVILGDQDAFKVEYVANGLAIKPLLGHGKTNLFVFTDYERFSFRLLAGPAAEVDFSVRVKPKRPDSYSGQGQAAPSVQNEASELVTRAVKRRAACAGFDLVLERLAWPKTQSTLLVTFRVSAQKKSALTKEQGFEPGDFAISQDERTLPIETLYLEGLRLSKDQPLIRGTLVLRYSAITADKPMLLTFTPDFLKGSGRCLSVPFSRRATGTAKKKT